MKVPHKNETYVVVSHHHWAIALLMVLGFGILAVAGFWIRKCKASNVSRHEYSALRRADSGGEGNHSDTQLYDESFIICRRFLTNNDRYDLRTQLEHIGSRQDKHWFIVQDIALGAERILSLITLSALCPITPSQMTRETVLALFRGLQHPYIHPVLDIEFWDSQVALISPLNQDGSLRDLIYSSLWYEDWNKKSSRRGEGLPLWQVQRLGRQILEALLFLRDRSFPPFYHLHSGNVILQNGVARLAGLENSLLGLSARPPNAPDVFAFGHLLFEMTTGYELPTPPSPAHLQLELERVPRVAEVLRLIFQNTKQPPNLEELLCCDLFRCVELRELRGINALQCRYSSEVLDLLSLAKDSLMPTATRRIVGRLVERQLEDIIEEELEEIENDTFVKVLR